MYGVIIISKWLVKWFMSICREIALMPGVVWVEEAFTFLCFGHGLGMSKTDGYHKGR